MTGTAIPATWRAMRPADGALSYVRRQMCSDTKQFRFGGRPRVPV